MKINKLASIIIRTKNEDKWLEDCINSIKQQDYKHWEIIVVDNYSTDKTLSICDKYNIKVVNTMRESNGTYINYLGRYCLGSKICGVY